jgi:hypothetical protein
LTVFTLTFMIAWLLRCYACERFVCKRHTVDTTGHWLLKEESAQDE